MAVILCLETSTNVCSVALYEHGKALAQAEIHQPQSHAAQLASMIQQVLKTANLPVKAIDAVAVSGGPGSYTGLRIGISTAKGLCFALDVHLIAVGSLDLLAFQGSAHNANDALLCPMIDARRMEVYCLVANHTLEIIEPVAAKVIDQDSFSELLQSHKMLFFGDGSGKCSEILRHPNATFIPDIFPQALALGALAEKKYKAGRFEDLVQFKPFYLKEFVAQKARTGI